MHTILNFPAEITLLVFENLDLKSLYRTALVCRGWSELASQVQWANFEVPISALLVVLLPEKHHVQGIPPAILPPEDIKDISDYLHANSNWAIQRFLKRSQTITSSLADVELPHWLYQIFKEIATMIDSRPFWPRLSKLQIIVDNINNALLEFLVQCPLKSLIIIDGYFRIHQEPSVMQVLLALTPAVQRVTELTMETYYRESVDINMLPMLDTLRIGGVFNGKTWVSLSSCPLLRRIIFLGNIVDHTVIPRGSLEKVSVFPSLQELVQTDMEDNFMAGLCAVSRMPELQVARFNLFSDDMPERLEVIHRRLEECHKLRELAIRFIWSYPWDISRLVRLHQLRILRLLGVDLLMKDVSLDDEMVEGIARGLPNLVELQVTITGSSMQWDNAGLLSPRVVTTITSLASLSTHCHDLEKLEFVMSIPNGGQHSLDPVDATPFINLSVFRLHVVATEQEFSPHLGHVLAKMCPEVDVFESVVWRLTAGCHQLWEELQDLGDVICRDFLRLKSIAFVADMN
ncbi:hypothetical protein FRB99_000294 [Tulasnella sp. 403]|nr:hypothetical protein FRB99_000294 [Tulasnella sp. 403]